MTLEKIALAYSFIAQPILFFDFFGFLELPSVIRTVLVLLLINATIILIGCSVSISKDEKDDELSDR